MARARRRGVSPAVGVVILVVIVLLLAGTFGVVLPRLASLERERETARDITGPGRERPAGGESDGRRGDLLWPVDDAPGATGVTYRVEMGIGAGADTVGNSLNSVVLDFADGSVNASRVDARSEVLTVGIDRNGDGAIDVNATGDVECCPPDDGVIVSDGGSTLRIEFSGNHDVEAGDVIVVAVTDLANPSAGTYDVTVTINGETSATGTVTIG